jgi:FO synthase
MTPADLVRAPLGDLMAEAASMRDTAWGNRITFSPKVFIPLTMLCRDRCGYCTFAKPPARLEHPFLDIEQVLAIAGAGAEAGCREALFTLGEAPEDRYTVAGKWLAEAGHTSTVDYLVAAAGAVLTGTGLLPHANAGALSQEDLERLRAVSPSQGMMLETLSTRLAGPGGAHHRAPDKTPERRLATLEAAGRARVPFTTGILVGIGETRHERIEALAAIAESHRRHGHIQEVIVQNFRPKPGTAMVDHPPCPPDEMLWSVAAARLILGPDMHLQAPPNLSDPDDLAALIGAGIDDWGGVSPVTPDHVNPERPWPDLEILRQATEAAGKVLAPRLTVYPEYVTAAEEWLHPDVRFAVLCASDAEGLARPLDNGWAPGSVAEPPILLPYPGTPRAGGPVGEVLAGVALGQEVGVDEITTLLGAHGPELARICEVADELRARTVGDVVTFVRNRNINYTNVCTFKCRFCAFSKGPLSLNLRGDPYLLDTEEIQRRVVEAVDCGATEVCLQGGIHPSFDGDYYVDVARAVKAVAPQIHIHGFTALEVFEGARRLGVDLRDYLLRLKDNGLSTLPGTAAEILDDEVRALICPDKVNTEEWLEVHRVAHSVGLRSNVTIMFGHVERPVHVARHFVRARALQRETGGFTEVVPLPFVHMASPIFLQRKARPGPTFREALLLHAVARIAFTGAIDNIQCSWVKLGLEGARQCLMAGVNDLGGTLMNENISRAAGAEHGQGVEEDDLAAVVAPLGRPLEQRTTLYGRVRTVGRRLPGPPAHAAEPVTITRRPSAATVPGP